MLDTALDLLVAAIAELSEAKQLFSNLQHAPTIAQITDQLTSARNKLIELERNRLNPFLNSKAAH